MYSFIYIDKYIYIYVCTVRVNIYIYIYIHVFIYDIHTIYMLLDVVVLYMM